MSTLKVNNIAGVSGGTSPPITLSGDTATLGSGATIGHAAKVVSAIDTFYITNSNFGTTVQYWTVTPYSNSWWSPVSGIVTRETTHNSAFSFSRTGVYEVKYQLQFDDSDDENNIRARCWATNDGTVPSTTNYDDLVYIAEFGRTATNFPISGSFLLNITSTNYRIRFSNDTSSTTQSGEFNVSTSLHSYVQFIQLGNSI
tara:strand:- start:1096 stop:1695 length:600 start_codon:yes stop_codon:yes gene_type:complete